MPELGPTPPAELRDQVALACRIIALEGYVDLTLGHVSSRNPGDRTIWIKRKGIALDEVTPDDIIALDIDDPTMLLDTRFHLESVMHTEIYRARPDVGAVIHGHPPYATALGASSATLELLTHDAILFADGLATFDEGSWLITEPHQGRAVADALGACRAALLRNHGVVVADVDVRWAVLTAVTLERAIRFQALVHALGEPRPIAQHAAEEIRPVKYQHGLIDEYWAAWVRRVHRAAAHPAIANT